MPDFPGIEKAESTSEWDAGFPLVHKIRPKDEDYWKNIAAPRKRSSRWLPAKDVGESVWQFDSDTVSHSDESNARPHARGEGDRSRHRAKRSLPATQRPQKDQETNNGFPLSRGRGSG